MSSAISVNCVCIYAPLWMAAQVTETSKAHKSDKHESQPETYNINTGWLHFLDQSVAETLGLA